jgi:hypothetical protein
MEIRHLLEQAVDKHREDFERTEATQVVLASNETLFIRNAIDSYFDIACRAQDSVLAYVSATYRTSLPSSLSDCARKLAQNKVMLSPDIGHALSAYWADTGELLRQYRDLAQHHAVVASEATLIKTPSGSIEIALVLPGNPDIKSPKDWKYGSQGKLAYPFCERSYLDLFSFIYRVLFVLARSLGYTETFTRRITFRAPMGPTPPESRPVPSAEEVHETIWSLRRDLKDQCSSAYGAINDPPRADV